MKGITFKGGGELGEFLFRKHNMYTKQFKKTQYPTSINHDIPNITGNLLKKTKSFQIDYKAKTDMSTG